MVGIPDLGLTPSQASEVEQFDPELVAAWLAAASDPSIKSPAGLFLSGVRSGEPPHVGAGRESDRLRLVNIAEKWLDNIGCLFDRPDAVLAELFDDRGSILHPWRADQELRDRMVSAWELRRVDGLRVEEEFADRARRYREGRREP